MNPRPAPQCDYQRSVLSAVADGAGTAGTNQGAPRDVSQHASLDALRSQWPTMVELAIQLFPGDFDRAYEYCSTTLGLQTSPHQLHSHQSSSEHLHDIYDRLSILAAGNAIARQPPIDHHLHHVPCHDMTSSSHSLRRNLVSSADIAPSGGQAALTNLPSNPHLQACRPLPASDLLFFHEALDPQPAADAGEEQGGFVVGETAGTPVFPMTFGRSPATVEVARAHRPSQRDSDAMRARMSQNLSLFILAVFRNLSTVLRDRIARKITETFEEDMVNEMMTGGQGSNGRLRAAVASEIQSMEQSIIAAGASQEEASLLVTEFSGDVEQAISVWRQRQSQQYRAFEDASRGTRFRARPSFSLPPNTSTQAQLQMIGERLYSLIEPTQPALAGKITGMLLEGYDIPTLCGIINCPVSLQRDVRLAISALEKNGSQRLKAGGPQLLPKHVEDVMVKEAERNGDTCTISFEKISFETAAVTSCGHVFNRESIVQWLSSKADNVCPQCRQKCTVRK